MSDILSNYGKDSRQTQAGRATNGGQQNPKSLPYSAPVGPTDQMHEGPGIGGTNFGNCGYQSRG